jgi:hypothetical protein
VSDSKSCEQVVGLTCLLHTGGMDEDAGPRLSDDELRELIGLLARYCNHDLDQFDDWRLAMPWGDAYVSISHALPPGRPRDTYTEVWPFASRLAEPDTSG